MLGFPGDNECRAVKTKFLSGVDTNGCGVPVAVSQTTVSPDNGVESAVTPANVVLKIASTQQAQDYFAEPVPLFPKLIEGRTLEVRAVLYVWISN